MSRRPDIRSFIDPLTNTTQSLDFQKIIRDRSFYIVNQNQELTFPPADPPVVQYLEVTVGPFSSSLYQDIIFPTPFSGAPYVAFEPSQSQFIGTDGEETPSVAWWITDLGVTGFRANFSAPFTGKITYRGVYTAGSYPVYVNRATNLSGTFAWCAAGQMSAGGGSSVTMSWATLPDNPKFLNYNPVGTTSDTTLNIGQNISAVTSSYAVNDLSIAYDGLLQFIVLSNTSGSYFQATPDTGIPGPTVTVGQGFDANQSYPNESYSPTGLLAWWRFETSASSYSFPDNSSGGTHTLETVGAPTALVSLSSDIDANFASNPGKLYENVSSSYVMANTLPSGTLQDVVTGSFEFEMSDFSISAHVNFDSFAFTDSPVVWRGLVDLNYADWEVFVKDNGAIHAAVFESNSGLHRAYKSTPGLITPGTWYHIGVVFDYAAKSFQFYLDGLPITTTFDVDIGWPGFNNSPTSQFRIGELRDLDYVGLSQTLADLKIDQLAIYNRQLTAAEMTVLYNGIVT